MEKVVVAVSAVSTFIALMGVSKFFSQGPLSAILWTATTWPSHSSTRDTSLFQKVHVLAVSVGQTKKLFALDTQFALPFPAMIYVLAWRSILSVSIAVPLPSVNEMATSLPAASDVVVNCCPNSDRSKGISLFLVLTSTATATAVLTHSEEFEMSVMLYEISPLNSEHVIIQFFTIVTVSRK